MGQHRAYEAGTSNRLAAGYHGKIGFVSPASYQSEQAQAVALAQAKW